MSANQLIVQKAAKKQLLKLPIKIHQRILDNLESIQINPLIVPKLQGALSNYRKFRIGDYRIVYTFNSKESSVSVVKIEHRQGVYK